MSWFNLYRKVWIDGVEFSVATFDKIMEQIREDENITRKKTLNEDYELRQHYGKDIPFYDELTLNEMGLTEIKKLEEDKDAGPIPIWIEDKSNEYVDVNKILNHTSKRKVRTLLPKKIRDLVLETYDHTCILCNRENANQVHHIDNNPSNNKIGNLQLLCYDCHLQQHRKRK